MTNLAMLFVAIRGMGCNIVARGALNTKAQKAQFNELIATAEAMTQPSVLETVQLRTISRILFMADSYGPQLPAGPLDAATREFYTTAARMIRTQALSL